MVFKRLIHEQDKILKLINFGQFVTAKLAFICSKISFLIAEWGQKKFLFISVFDSVKVVDRKSDFFFKF